MKPKNSSNYPRLWAVCATRTFHLGESSMRVVQALYWLQDMLSKDDERSRVIERLRKILAEPAHGSEIRADLRSGLSALPIWMQDFVRELIEEQRSNRAATRTRK